MSDMLSSRNAIQAALKKRIKAVEIPDFGTVSLRRLSGLDTARLGDIGAKATERTLEDNEKLIQCKVVQLGLVDENGERIFGDSDLDQIAQMDRDILERIQNEVMAYSGMGRAGDAEKNSESIPASGLPSVSRVN